MPYFAVQYTYDDRTSVRDRVRPEHRRYLGGLVDRGVLLCSGPYAGPTEGTATEPDGALLLFSADSAAHLEPVLDADPFAREGLVADRRVRPWQPVLGPWA